MRTAPEAAEKLPARVRLLWPGLILLICLVGSGFARLWYQRQIVGLGRDCQELEAEKLAIGRKLAMAQARVARLQAPAPRGAGADLALPSADRLVRVSWREVRRPGKTLSAMELATAAPVHRN
ncbi:MAG: hypothetical protein LBT98_01870 [Puniceicoccales bacterium]|nr:hypothetical protein [Puniceicoccales bacterium]